MGLSYRAAPAFTNTGSAGVTSTTVTKQAGTSSGDWIFIYVFAGTATMACTGFTAKPDSSGFGGLLYRLADGTEGASFSVTGLAGNRASTMIVTVAGAAGTLDPPTVATPTSGGPATSVTVPGVTLANTGDWLLWFCADQNGYSGAGYSITPPAGFTSQGTNGALASNATIMLADDQTTSPGATGTQTGTFTSPAYFSGVLAGLTPAAAAAAAGAGAGAATAAARQAAVAAAAGTGTVTASASVTNPVITFPGTGPNPLGVKVELLLAGTWTDITQLRDAAEPGEITGMGRADWTSTLQAATLTLTLNNDGRFTPKLAAGAYYPNITRNCQIRVGGERHVGDRRVAYSGFRFWGEVAEWPPAWDPSGRDVYVDITANGIWRRMSQLATTLGSAYTRYNSLTLTGTGAAPLLLADGGRRRAPGSWSPTTRWRAPATRSSRSSPARPGLSLAACTDFKGSDGIPAAERRDDHRDRPRRRHRRPTTAPGSCCPSPPNGDSASRHHQLEPRRDQHRRDGRQVRGLPERRGDAADAAAELRRDASSRRRTTTTNVKGKPVLVSCELTPSGGNVAFALRIITPGAAGITESLTGTLTTASRRRGHHGAVRPGERADGHRRRPPVRDLRGGRRRWCPPRTRSAGTSGEFAMDRFTRICGEMGIAAETIGTASSPRRRWAPSSTTPSPTSSSPSRTSTWGCCSSRGPSSGSATAPCASMANQAAAAIISYTAGIARPVPRPRVRRLPDPEQRHRHQRSTGYTQQAILTAGPMSRR